MGNNVRAFTEIFPDPKTGLMFSQGGGRPVGSSQFGRWLLNLLGGSCVNLFWLGKLGGDNCHTLCVREIK